MSCGRNLIPEIYNRNIMKYNLLVNKGLYVSELYLATMTFGGRGIWSAIGTLLQDQLIPDPQSIFDTPNI